LGAIASNADILVSIGGVQSNHTRMVAATAAKIGMKCVVIQESWVPHEDAVYDRVGNILLTRLMGADSRIVPDGLDIGIRKSWEDAIQSMKDAGGKPYPIPAGASVHKYGGLGYVGFAEEVRAQEKQMGIAFDYIIVCVVTGSTQAGMIVGFAADNRAHRVIVTDGSGTPQQLRAQVREIVDNTAELVELGRAVRDDEIVILEDRRSACARAEVERLEIRCGAEIAGTRIDIFTAAACPPRLCEHRRTFFVTA
jgi:1-aminocyclopropane-1-carboxylate deaminase